MSNIRRPPSPEELFEQLRRELIRRLNFLVRSSNWTTGTTHSNYYRDLHQPVLKLYDALKNHAEIQPLFDSVFALDKAVLDAYNQINREKIDDRITLMAIEDKLSEQCLQMMAVLRNSSINPTPITTASPPTQKKPLPPTPIRPRPPTPIRPIQTKPLPMVPTKSGSTADLSAKMKVDQTPKIQITVTEKILNDESKSLRLLRKEIKTDLKNFQLEMKIVRKKGDQALSQKTIDENLDKLLIKATQLQKKINHSSDISHASPRQADTATQKLILQIAKARKLLKSLEQEYKPKSNTFQKALLMHPKTSRVGHFRGFSKEFEDLRKIQADYPKNKFLQLVLKLQDIFSNNAILKLINNDNTINDVGTTLAMFYMSSDNTNTIQKIDTIHVELNKLLNSPNIMDRLTEGQKTTLTSIKMFFDLMEKVQQKPVSPDLSQYSDNEQSLLLTLAKSISSPSSSSPAPKI